MNKFKILRYYGYIILGIPTLLFMFFMSGFFIYLSRPNEKTVVIKQEAKRDTVIVLQQPIESKTIEKTTTNNSTTIIQQPETPKQTEIQVVKPEPVIKKQPIDTTKTHDTTSKK